MRVWIGFGENLFTMSRGSFKYKQRIQKKRQLVFLGEESQSEGTTLVYRDEMTKSNLTFMLREDDGQITLELQSEAPRGVNRYWISLNTPSEGEHYYGCGETYSEFDLSGQKIRIWVAEHQNAGRITKKIIRDRLTGPHPNRKLRFDKYESYYAQPTFVSSGKYFVHCDVNAYSEFDFRKSGEVTFYFQEPPRIIADKADSYEALSKKLSDLLGYQRRLPEWIYDGAILAIQEGTEKIDEKLAKCEAAGVKVCGVWSQDWCGCRRTGFGYQVMWNWEWDKELYHNLDAKIKEWNAKGIRFLGYINPFIAIEKDLYKEAAEKGYCVKDKEGKDYLVTITTFPAAMVDFTNPAAYSWYKKIIKENMIDLGLSGWMADFGEYLPVDSVLFSGEDPQTVHNRWPAIWAQLNKEVIEECGKSDEIFFFTRAGHTGTIAASAMMWTGDHHVDWSIDDGIGAVIPASLSLAMSGYGITHSDIGGYTTIMQMRRSKELLLRWEELCAFSPLYRSHEGNQPVNDVQFDDDDELLAQLAKFSQIHFALKHYLKELVDEDINSGVPVMRPIFYHYDEPRAYTEKTEYLLGRDMLVAPIIKKGATKREVYLPNDRWIHAFTGKEYGGGCYEIEAPIGQPPVFIRANGGINDEVFFGQC